MPDSEEDELLEELVRARVEVYKKSATAVVLLSSIPNDGPVGTPAIADPLVRRTGWELTERGSTVTLRRLTDFGLLAVDEQPGHRTGARRHVFERVSTHAVVTVASPRWVVPSEVPVQESHELLGVGSRES